MRAQKIPLPQLYVIAQHNFLADSCFFFLRIFSLHDVRATCRTVPGLNKDQLSLCYQASDVTAVAIEGLEIAIKECQYQVRDDRSRPCKRANFFLFLFLVSMASMELFIVDNKEQESSHL